MTAPADIRVIRGTRASLPSHANDGALVVCKDTAEVFLGMGGVTPLLRLGGGQPRVVTVPYAASTNIDARDIDVIRITLTGNITINFTNGYDGQRLLLELTQDAPGGRTVGWGANVRFGTDLTSIPAGIASKTARVGLIYSQPAGKFDVIAYAGGF